MNQILQSLYHDRAVLPRRQALGLPALDPSVDLFVRYLHEEMRACFLNGHDHAALVMACALIDFSIKDAIYFEQYLKADYVFNLDEWDKVDALQFGQGIKLAKSRRIVTKEEAKQLEWVREHVRNVYMHGQTPDWVKDKDDTIIEGDLATGEVTEKCVKARDNIMLQRTARIGADRNICDQVVRLVDGLVRTLVARGKNSVEEWKRRNPSSFNSAHFDRVVENMQKRGLEPGLVITSDWPKEDEGSGES